jgi:hypothetical protein
LLAGSGKPLPLASVASFSAGVGVTDKIRYSPVRIRLRPLPYFGGRRLSDPPREPHLLSTQAGSDLNPGPLVEPFPVIADELPADVYPNKKQRHCVIGRKYPRKRLLTVVSFFDTIIESMARHGKGLKEIFADPVRASINWSDIESLLAHHGANHDLQRIRRKD